MKFKLALLCLAFPIVSLFSQNSTDSAVARLSAKLDTLQNSTSALNDSLNAVTELLNNVGINTYLVDEDAITRFNKNRDSIYSNSSYSLLKCRSCEENVKKKGKLKLQLIKQNRNTFSLFTFWASLLVFLLMWYYGIKLFLKSSLCRVSGNLPPEKRPYSYSRVQLFFWTMIIFSLYLYFFAFTGILLPLNYTVVLLLGGGVLVYSGGQIIDFKKPAPNAATTGVPEQETEGLFTDILSDDVGITIHRFQSLVFNIIYGIGFVLMFFKNINSCLYPFPEFDSWQFALLGISSFTYVGLKAAEKKPLANSAT